MSARIAQLVERGRELKASDLHVDPAFGAAYRIFTTIARIETTIDRDDIEQFLTLALDRRSRARLERVGIADCAYADERVGAVRVHASRGTEGSRVAIRILARAIPEFETLGLPAIVGTFEHPGLYLVAGPPGSGKSTTIASILDRLNTRSQKHLVSFEDPIEYVHGWASGIFTQYEVGRDVTSFAEGVRAALRADPDVLFIGELRDADAVSACLQAAESGHVVFAALHTPAEASLTVNRLVGLAPLEEHGMLRGRLSESLRALIALRLIPRADGSGLCLASEVVIANDAVRRLIREGLSHQIRGVVESHRRDGMRTLEAHLSELVSTGIVTLADARAVAVHPALVRANVAP